MNTEAVEWEDFDKMSMEYVCMWANSLKKDARNVCF